MEKRVKLNILGIRISFKIKKLIYILDSLKTIIHQLPKKKRKYDEVVSLGFNCECTYRIKDVIPDVGHYIYSWCFIIERKGFIDTLFDLDKFNSFSDFEVMPWGMYVEKDTRISFHTRHEKNLFDENGNLKQDIHDENKAELISRIQHLTKKTKELLKSDKKTLFILKIHKTEFAEDKKFIKDTYKILEKQYLSGKFKLLTFIQKEDFSKAEIKELKTLDSEKMNIVVLKSLAPVDDTVLEGDILGWILRLTKEIYF